MAVSIPADSKKFRAGITPIFLWFLAFCLPLLVCFILIMDGLRFDWRALVCALAFTLVQSLFWAWILSLLFPVSFSAEGVYGQSFWGRQRFVRWQDIAAARTLRIINLRWLRLYPAAGRKVTWIALYQSLKAEFRQEMQRLAPPDSPVLNVKNLLIAALLAGLAFAPVARAASPARPNFLFIYTDDQRYDAMGVAQREEGERARFPWFKTPNMDRLAAEGVRFRNAFATSSLCSPSRAAFLTGRYNHLNGVVNNHTPFPTNSVTHATVLRAAGYKTGYIGKWHMSNQRGQRPGFDFSASYIAHGRYGDCPFEINGVSQPTKGWVDDVATDFALDFLRTNKAGPFLLVVGFKSPHDPRTPPDRLKNAFADEACRPAVNKDAKPPYLVASGRAGVGESADKSEGRLNYFRCIAGADENLGRLLAALDELGLAENTMVIYTSDNGYYLGDHGLGDKRSAYEESIRIPLLLRYPKLGLKGIVVDEPVLNIDLAPTLIQYAGLRAPPEMQGQSWRPLLERKSPGPPPGWRTSFFYEYFFERGFPVPTLFAVRTDTAKLIKYKDHDDWTELFDLARDPYEMKNLCREPAAAKLRAALDADYDRQKQAVGFVLPAYDSDTVELPEEKPLHAWVLDYRFDKDAGDKVVDASGKGNHGHATNVPLADGREGGEARRFEGKGCIAVPKSPSLNPSVRSWTVEVVFKADAPDGILVAHGRGGSWVLPRVGRGQAGLHRGGAEGANPGRRRRPGHRRVDDRSRGDHAPSVIAGSERRAARERTAQRQHRQGTQRCAANRRRPRQRGSPGQQAAPFQRAYPVCAHL
jgi:arylsulfatase A-like enzyme